MAVEMPDSPAMVIRLKGSMRLRTARRAFWRGVSGLTSGPVRKRAYQLTMGGACGRHTTTSLMAGFGNECRSAALRAAIARITAVEPRLAPAFFTLQALAAAAPGCGLGSSGKAVGGVAA